MPEPADTLRLFTVRSDGQFNTTIYSLDDRFRGVYGSRMVLFMSRRHGRALGLQDGDIGSRPAQRHRRRRRAPGRRACGGALSGAPGCIAGYFPECNPLIPLWHHAKESKVPAAKVDRCTRPASTR
jgi:anaerobic selenocysteine-containing dehydrogenase